MPTEELKRQLERLTREQEQLRREAEQLAQQIAARRAAAVAAGPERPERIAGGRRTAAGRAAEWSVGEPEHRRAGGGQGGDQQASAGGRQQQDGGRELRQAAGRWHRYRCWKIRAL